MKKRLLITSIVMMLVVAVALGTSTYAWFTSNATVETNAVTLVADTSDAPSLGISWVDGNYGTTITATGPSGSDAFSPATPLTLSTTETKTNSTVAFNTALTTPANGGDMVFAANGTATNVYTWNDGASGHTSFFLKNLSPSNAMTTITISATIADTAGETNVGANKLIRVGVFKKNGSSGNYELLGVLANNESVAYNVVDNTSVTTMDGSTVYYKRYLGKYVLAVKGADAESLNAGADYYEGMPTPADTFYTQTTATTPARAVYGQIQAEHSVNAMATVACVTSIDITEGSGLAAGGKIELVVKVWEDAIALGDAEQEKSASIKLNFLAA